MKITPEEDYELFLKTYNLSNYIQDVPKFKKCYFSLYAINFLSTRIEVSKYFVNDYYQICLSTLKETILLFKDSYIRAASLILRSSIENFLKFVLEKHNLTVHDKSYSANRNTFENNIDKIVNPHYSLIKKSLLSLNNKLFNIYRTISSLSHSLTSQSKDLTLQFFLQKEQVDINYKKEFIDKLEITLETIQSFNLYLTKFSTRNWTTQELMQLLSINIGNKRMNSWIKFIKEDQDITFHCF